MPYLIWALLTFPSLIMAIAGRLLAPILPLFCNANGWLPDWLSWFQTPDNSCDGDAGHRARWPKDGFFWTYCRRVAWLLRNVAYGFDIDVLGKWVEPKDQITVIGNPDIGDLSGISGTCYRELIHEGKFIAFQWFYVRHYSIFSFHKCIRIGLGWKLWNGVKPERYSAQYWFYFNPVK